MKAIFQSIEEVEKHINTVEEAQKTLILFDAGQLNPGDWGDHTIKLVAELIGLKSDLELLKKNWDKLKN